MSLYQFAFCYRSRFNQLAEIAGSFEDEADIANKIVGEFKQKKVSFYRDMRITGEKNATDAYYQLMSYKTKNGDDIWMHFTLNNQPDKQKWFFKEFIPGEYFVENMLLKNYVVCGDIAFDSFDKLEVFLAELQGVAEEEVWKFNESLSKFDYPILKSYIEYTLMRLREENKIIYNAKGDKCLFNTGLLDRHFLLDIYVAVDVSKRRILDQNIEVFENPVIFLEDDRIAIEIFGETKPRIANYFNDISEIVFDPELDLKLNWQHIFNNRSYRINNSSVDIREIVQRFKGNESILKKKAKRNYKLVQPQYYNGVLQFLLPVYLGTSFTGTPDFALVLEYDKTYNYYRGTTILTIPQAYTNARLITKIEAPWLTKDA